MARQDMSSATAAAMAAYEARDQAKVKGEKRNPLFAHIGLVLIGLFVLGYGIYYWLSHRGPPLDSPPAVLAAFIASPKFDKMSDSTKVKYHEAWQKVPWEDRRKIEEGFNEDQKELMAANRRTEDPNSEGAKRWAEREKQWKDAKTAEEKRALLAQMRNRRQPSTDATSRPAGQGGRGGPGGGGPGGPGGGGPGGMQGAREGASPDQKAERGEMGAVFREMRSENGH